MKDQFLERLLSSVSVSGYEEPVQAVVEQEMADYADEIWTDEMENRICVLNPGSSTRVMLSAHADEIGLIISNITEKGRLQVTDRGGIIPETYPGQQICIRNSRGMVYGVVEASRALFKKDNLGTGDFIIDIGAESKEDALNYVSVGDPIVLDTHIRSMTNGRFTARALDDRLGVYIIMEALKRAKERACTAGVYAAATVGEETTKTGAYWSSSRIKPSLAVVVDVTYTSDNSGVNPADTGTVELGKGPVLCYSPIVAKRLNRKMEECAQKAGIPIQWEVASRLTHTDGDQIHFSNGGVPMALVSIPLRYMHTPAEVVDWSDVEGCIELIAAFLGDVSQ